MTSNSFLKIEIHVCGEKDADRKERFYLYGASSGRQAGRFSTDTKQSVLRETGDIVLDSSELKYENLRKIRERNAENRLHRLQVQKLCCLYTVASLEI